MDRIRIVGAIIDIEHLDFAYGDQLVLKQITLPIEEGSTLGVIGPNGGGKSTLLKLLLNQHRPTRGALSRPFCSRRPSSVTPRMYSMIMQGPSGSFSEAS